MNGLPRKAVLIAALLASAALLLNTLPYVWPFAAAFLFSSILEPFVRFASKGFGRLKPSAKRSLATFLGMILLFGLAGTAFSAAVRWIWQELGGFLRSFPQLLQQAADQAIPFIRELYSRFQLLLPENLPLVVETAFSSLGQYAVKWAGALSAQITSSAWNTAASIPHALLGSILTLMATYHITTGRERIAAFWQRTFPPEITKRSRLIRASLFRALMGQLRSQLMISLMVMFFLMLMLGLTGIRYGAVIGMLIGIADALPLLGAGLFLLPWSLASFLGGQSGLGIILLFLYAGTIIIRQILEPKLIGRHLGIDPLAAMLAVYVGYRLFGFGGLLAGPILLYMAKAVLDADKAATQAPS